jgi:hypothetical protein
MMLGLSVACAIAPKTVMKNYEKRSHEIKHGCVVDITGLGASLNPLSPRLQWAGRVATEFRKDEDFR